ncbi:hypothetical protein K2173_014122 [Erythroxylum novogranatense]|uniref:TPX2 C-terminal domain-containing protein n=1 Tax=Erythroxylum novogranatense TaxID=1862640 RepID=A0AAV8SDD5_9ROSI|nr:hypothetical protein K2173_014122 [Erythroxylum novogranatense]
MGELTCLVQPFSYAAGIPSSEASEGKPIHPLDQSVSFGRFMSESLSWEKWSTFSHNRYVEEAEGFSRPGSVAQMKAFFEAHYKNLAERKAAALLEQANVTGKNVAEPETKSEVCETTPQDSEMMTPCSEANGEAQDVKVMAATQTSYGNEGERTEVREVDSTPKSRVLVQDCDKGQTLNEVGIVDNEKEVRETDLSASRQMETPLLKDDLAPISKKKLPVSGSKSSIYVKERKLPFSPAKQAAPLRPKKENIATPINKKSTVESDRIKSTQKSMNFTPVRQLNKITSTLIRKIDNSSVSSNCKASKNYATPVSILKDRKQPIATPVSENRREMTPLHPSASGSKTVRPKWHFFPTDCSKFMTGCRNKSQSPKLSTPFSFRTEERAARRKEKLEEKFNAEQAQKVQLQATLKEKAETELKRLRQSLCFKARPLPKFYKERAVTNIEETIPLTRFQSPVREAKSYPNSTQRRNPQLLGGPPSAKTTGFKQAMDVHRPRSLSSHLKGNVNENTCPNIQCK